MITLPIQPEKEIVLGQSEDLNSKVTHLLSSPHTTLFFFFFFVDHWSLGVVFGYGLLFIGFIWIFFQAVNKKKYDNHRTVTFDDDDDDR